MKVRELIEYLSKSDDDVDVLISWWDDVSQEFILSHCETKVTDTNADVILRIGKTCRQEWLPLLMMV